LSDGKPYLSPEILVLEFILTNAALLKFNSGDRHPELVGTGFRNESEGRTFNLQKVLSAI